MLKIPIPRHSEKIYTALCPIEAKKIFGWSLRGRATYAGCSKKMYIKVPAFDMKKWLK